METRMQEEKVELERLQDTVAAKREKVKGLKAILKQKI
jgi:hypothetical protein